MTDVLIWPLLYKGVVAVWAADGYACESYFGWRGPAQQMNAPGIRKVSWVPGDDKGDAGLLAPPILSEGDRSLATFNERFTIYCHAVDAVDKSEAAQYTAARLLFDEWFRALWHASANVGTVGRFAVEALTWETEKKVRPHGACLRAVCTAQAKIPDTPYATAPIDLAAELTGQFDYGDENEPIGGVQETQTITKDDEL
jgi:hypothetical protein